MIYKIEMFNVIFLILARNEEEKQCIDTWWQYFVVNKDMQRVSVVLAFLKYYKLKFSYHWGWSRELSVINNLRAYFGFKKQMREFTTK